MIYSFRVSFFRAELAFYTLHKSLSTQYHCTIGKLSHPLAYLRLWFSPKGPRRIIHLEPISFGLPKKASNRLRGTEETVALCWATLHLSLNTG